METEIKTEITKKPPIIVEDLKNTKGKLIGKKISRECECGGLEEGCGSKLIIKFNFNWGDDDWVNDDIRIEDDKMEFIVIRGEGTQREEILSCAVSKEIIHKILNEMILEELRGNENGNN